MTGLVVTALAGLFFSFYKVDSCETDVQCPLDQCCARRLGFIAGCVDMSSLGQRCGKSIIGLCSCTKGLVCTPEHWFFNLFKFGEGRCTLSSTVVSTSPASVTSIQGFVPIG